MTPRACREVSGSSIESAAVEWIAIAERWLATMSCNSRAMRARSDTTAWARSISASRAVCSARSRAASAASRWLRTIQPVAAGMRETSPTTRPISRASGFRKAARGTTVKATVTRPHDPGHPASRGGLTIEHGRVHQVGEHQHREQVALGDGVQRQGGPADQQGGARHGAAQRFAAAWSRPGAAGSTSGRRAPRARRGPCACRGPGPTAADRRGVRRRRCTRPCGAGGAVVRP